VSDLDPDLFDQFLLFVTEFSSVLQTTEVILKARIKRIAALDANHVEECIRSNSSVAWIWDSGANEPDCSAVRATRIFVAFSGAWWVRWL